MPAAAAATICCMWPEGGVDSDPFRTPGTARTLDELVEQAGAPLLMNAATARDEHTYNTSMLWEGGGAEQLHDKVNPVPFGEYVPLAWLLKPFVGKLTEGVSDFSTADAQARPIEDIGVLICFESLFPDMSRRLCRQGAAYLVNASNDAWFSTWSASRQLLAMSAFRSIETRRYLVRPVNHGISAVIDPKGRIVQSLGLLQEGVIVADIRKLTYQTFYTRFGPVIVWLWGLIGVALLARLWFDNRQR